MTAVAASRATVRDLLELTKPRITTLVVLTAGAAYYVASQGPVRGDRLLHTLIGTAFVAAGTSALNQVVEAPADALMRRTMRRPIPAGRLAAGPAGAFAWSLGAVGIWYLAAQVGWPVALLAAATLLSYIFVYTPLKRRTSLATIVGAVPGALPVLGGWVAARGRLETEAWLLFGILFLWQMPHFLALAWIYRVDYERAGFRMLSLDADGRHTFGQATLYAAALLPVALAPAVVGRAGVWYFWGALGLSLWMAATAVAAARDPSSRNAMRAFRATLIYLPALLLLMMADRVG